MIDFHSHFLPKMDDGSSSLEESIQMLEESYRQGVTLMIGTSHFYPSKESPEHFIKRRNASAKHLFENLEGKQVPAIAIGAEVYFFEGISRLENLSKLCVIGTNVLLLEMPFRTWSTRMVDEVCEIAAEGEIQVVLAHIDRYLKDQKQEVWDRLEENGVKFQVNASAFLEGWFASRKIFKLLEEEKISALGSDCHNMDRRKPNLGEAVELVGKKQGQQIVKSLMGSTKVLLRGCKVFQM